jgi:hypothetical protein
VNGSLKAIFIECSFDDSVRDTDLYGHLCPRHLIVELAFLAERVQSVRKYEKMYQIEGTEEAEPKWSTVNLQEPPSPATLKKKRKRASEALGNGSPTQTLQPSPEPARGGRSASNTRRKTGHSDPPIGRAHSPLRPSETEADEYVSEESPNHDRAPMSPPLVRPHHQPPYLQSQQQGQHVGRQTNLAADRRGALHIAPPEKGGGGKSDVKHMGDALKGLTVHIIHIKDTLSDGPSQGDVILGQLRARGKESGLGCEFEVTSCGESVWV